MATGKSAPDASRLDAIVAKARADRDQRGQGYRDRALKLFPWVCGRCAREFTAANLQLLEVHHRDANHDHNPPDGSNWELLCTYCHENEHQRYMTEHGRDPSAPAASGATHQPFAALKALLRDKDAK